MRRFVVGLVLGVLGSAPGVRAQTPAELAETARSVATFQNPDGGFGATEGGRSTLGSTSAAIRILKNVGGSIPDVPACIRFVQSCYDRDGGGFAQTPGGTPDVGTTASGLMAIAELRVPAKEMTAGAIQYFSKHAQSFEDIRIAVAGLEAAQATSADFPAWIEKVKADRNPDGTWGQGAGKARATGSAAVALLRMGVDLDKKDAILAALREGQRPDGGWGAAEGGSDLGSTYRVMRAFFMLKETPDLDRLSGFIARCRHSHGGYAVKPDGEPNLGGTYFATTVLRWVRLLGGEPAFVETVGFQPLFNGRDLSGWEGETSLWSVKNGMLVGRSPGIQQNQFLATEKSYGDFVLKLTFRLVNGQGNSGVQFRSERIAGTEMKGYQADIGEGYWASLYDESRRNRTLAQGSERALKELHKTGWNSYMIRAVGDRITLALNGVPAVNYTEPDSDIARNGKIALQIHAGGPMEIDFKDILIQPLPSPVADDKTTPGFHLRTVQAPDGERKYTLYLPSGFDPSKTYPVILFLHGAGERGADGVRPAQVGIGPALLAHPEAYQAIVVIPQCHPQRTWAADSDEAKAALAALDQVMSQFKTDSNRVYLTGLSLGGAGTWSIAAAHPERFAAIVPVCGFGNPQQVKPLKDLPVWSFLGDADMDRIVTSTRAMLNALRDLGAQPRQTEYRGVGHNSWDRAYNDLEMVHWLLSQSRKRES
jgi:poly(3-hydroxybutyrate) depolymerase/prenyltransferase beta subunit